MTMTTKTLRSYWLDDLDYRLVESPTYKLHVEAWFGETMCGKYINYGYKQWGYHNLTSLRWLATNAQSPNPYSRMCKACLKHYKDVIIDG